MNIEIIAELAQGFEGCPARARLLLKAAAASGATAAKFQLVYADELATPDYKYYELFKSLEMADEVWISLAKYARELGIELHLDIFGTRSLALAEKLDIGAVKIHGTDIANLGLLKLVAKSSIRKVLLGAGGAYLSEVDGAIQVLASKNLIVILGFQGYPTPDDVNQIARVSLLNNGMVKNYSNIRVGFADHVAPEGPLRYALAGMALGAGALVLEKHLTLSKNLKLEDHESALNPDEFLEFTKTMYSCFTALGVATETEDFNMSKSEKEYRNMIRRHVVANRDLDIGAIISPEDLVLKRTSAKEPITDLKVVYQKILKQPIKANSPLSFLAIKD